MSSCTLRAKARDHVLNVHIFLYRRLYYIVRFLAGSCDLLHLFSFTDKALKCSPALIIYKKFQSRTSFALVGYRIMQLATSLLIL